MLHPVMIGFIRVHPIHLWLQEVLMTFENDDVREILEQSRAFLQEMERLVYGADEASGEE